MTRPDPGDGAAFEDRLDALEDALEKIVQWSEAYPVDIFPVPNMEKVADLLRDGGESLDGLSAYVTRRVVDAVGKIARDALGGE